MKMPEISLLKWQKRYGTERVLVAVETRTKGAGFVEMQAVETVSKKTARNFLHRHIKAEQPVKLAEFA